MYDSQKLKYFMLVLNLAGLILFNSSMQGQSTKKNLLFIITDQQRYDALSLAGNTVLQTPNLDRLGDEGAYFSNSYTPCAVCGPARASILTGHSIENTGVNTNAQTYDYSESVVMTMPTFDEVLTDNGYTCEYYGKWHTMTFKGDIYQNPIKAAKNGRSIFGSGGQSFIYRDFLAENEPTRELEAGQFWDTFTKWPYQVDPIDKYYGMTATELEEQNISRSQPDQHGELKMRAQSSMTAFQAGQAIEAIDRLKNEPFSITVSFHYPHAPMLPVEPYYSMYPAENMVAPVSISDDMQNSPYISSNGRLSNPEYSDPEKIGYMISNYYGLVREIDDWVGTILDTLDALGLSDNTMVIFTSDHGEMLGSHGMREKNVFYEESAHIPLLMRFPGEIAPQTTVEGNVSLIDLFPSILDYLGVEEQPSDGKSLRGLIEGTDTEHGKYVVTEWSHTSNTPNYMIIKDGWKLIVPNSATSTVTNALFDLNSDPHEMTNLLAERNNEKYYDQVEDLRASLLEWLANTGSNHYNGVRDREITETPYEPRGEVLIGRNSEWKYNDSGDDLGTDWYGTEFDDSGWSSAKAILGYGDGDETTILENGKVTYYFRKSFTIDTLVNYKSPMFLDLLIDDGAVVYLNGEYLAKRNMPSGEITSETLANSDVSGSSEFEFYSRLYGISGLVEGINVIAIEVHQSSIDSDDLSFDLGLEITADEATDISREQENTPEDYLLFEPYPNPFNPTTTIQYQLPQASNVKIVIYDAMGREVATLVNSHKSVGSHKIEFNGASLTSGIYYYRIQAGSFVNTKKMVLLK